MEKISVIVPVFNAHDYLERCLLSIVNQSYSNLEIILIDDCSFDGSEKICDSFFATYKNIRVIHLKHNRGVSYARNVGVSLSTAKYISFVDSDDYLDPDYFQTLSNDIDNDLVIGKIIYDYGNYKLLLIEKQISQLKNNISPYYFLISDDRRNIGNRVETDRIFGSVCRSLFKKEIIDKNRLTFNDQVVFGEDLLFMLSYVELVNSLAVTEATYYYSVNPFSVTNSLYNGYVEDYISKYKSFFDNLINFIRGSRKICTKKSLIDFQKMSFCIGFVINEMILSGTGDYSKIKSFFKRDNGEYLHFKISSIKSLQKVPPKRFVLLFLIKNKFWFILNLIWKKKRVSKYGSFD